MEAGPDFDTSLLKIEFACCLEPTNAGLFVSPGYGTHAIRVLDSYELILVKSGQLELFEEEKQFRVDAQQALLLWPNRRHGGLSQFQKDLSFFWIHFRLNSPETVSSLKTLKIPQQIILRSPERLYELFHRFITDQESGRLNRLEATLLFMLMLLELSRAAEEQGSARDGNNALVERVNTFIATHYNFSISTSMISKELKLNPDYLGRMYRKAKGYSVTKAIHKHRIKESRALLIQNQLSIKEIAFSCGFMDTAYFRRVFKSLCGIAPHEFRTLYCRTKINNH